jgi:uncharacterized membrane protein
MIEYGLIELLSGKIFLLLLIPITIFIISSLFSWITLV